MVVNMTVCGYVCFVSQRCFTLALSTTAAPQTLTDELLYFWKHTSLGTDASLYNCIFLIVKKPRCQFSNQNISSLVASVGSDKLPLAKLSWFKSRKLESPSYGLFFFFKCSASLVWRNTWLDCGLPADDAPNYRGPKSSRPLGNTVTCD